MKQVLRLRDCYTQIICIFKSLKIPHSSLFAVLTIMCLEARAQSPDYFGAVPPGELNVGDTIPEYVWHLPLQVVNHPEGKETITLDDYRGKLIILDFWAMWCSACFHDFPKQDSLNQQFPNDIAILKATYQTADKITKPIYSVVGDSILRAYFPYRQIPHYVWIDKTGALVATTASSGLSASNIKKVLHDESWSGNIKVDRDPSRPILLDAEMTDSLLQYALLYRGRLNGYATETIVRKANGQVRGRAMLNRPIRELFLAAIIPLFHELGERHHPKADILPSMPDETRYSMDFIVSPERSDSLYRDLLDFLNASSPYTGRIAKRKTTCLVLRRTGDDGLPVAKEGKPAWMFTEKEAYLRNKPLWVLTQALNGMPDFSPLAVVDETGLTGPVDIRLSGITTVEALQRDLKRYGLSLVKAERELYQFILTPKTDETTH